MLPLPWALHDRGGVLHAEEDAPEEHAHRAVVARPPGVSARSGPMAPPKPGVVVEAIQAPEAREGVRDGTAHVGLPAHVGMEVGAGLAELIRQAGTLVVLDVGDHDATALLDEEPDRRGADAARPAGDDRHFPIELSHAFLLDTG